MNKMHMVAAKTFFARMNEGRSTWLTDEKLLNACKEFFAANEYGVEQNVVFAGNQDFTSPLVGSNKVETIATIFRPKIEKYDMTFFGSLESILFDIIDNNENATLMLATDSLSYGSMLRSEELSVTIENLIDEGMYLLFVNGRSAHALFDEFKKLSMPIPLYD